MSVVYDPIAQAGELIEELRDLRHEAGEFRFDDNEDTAIESKRRQGIASF